MYSYQALPSFAAHLLQNHLEDISKDQLDLSRQHAVPILQYLTHLSDEQLIDITKESMIELLSHLSENRGADFIRLSLQRWLSDQLQIVGKLEIVAEDIILITYIRSRSFKRWVPQFTNDANLMLQLNDEIDTFFMGQNTSSINTYINILKENITTKENQLLEAQAIAHLGSYEWDIQKDTSVSTPELRKILGLTERQPYEAFMKSVHPDDVAKVKQNMSAAMASGEFECEFRYLSPNGEKTLWSLGVVNYTEGKPTTMQGTVQDITERKNIEKELTEKTIQLQRSNESLQQFASVASHDLKEPLRKIATFTDMILQAEGNVLSERSSGHLQKVKDAARRMQQMITDILSFSSIEGEGKKLTNLQAVLDEALEMLDQTIKEKGASIQVDPLPAVYADAAQIRQLFLNLLSNAMKFAKPDLPPQISITHSIVKGKSERGEQADKEYLQLVFTDNGIGFEKEYAEKIFGLFERLHAKTKYEGSGMGLSIARRIVENHKGSITASSAIGQGATFTITLPLHPLD